MDKLNLDLINIITQYVGFNPNIEFKSILSLLYNLGSSGLYLVIPRLLFFIEPETVFLLNFIENDKIIAEYDLKLKSIIKF